MSVTKKLFSSKDFQGIETVENIKAVYNALVSTLPDSEVINRRAWYRNANVFCATVAADYGLTVETVAGIVAAFSPLISWDVNKQYAINFIKRMQSGANLEGLGVFKKNVAKAVAIFNGANPVDVLGGNKVSRFYQNIMLNETVVTVDRHAIAIAYEGINTSGKSGNLTITSKMYLEVEQAYKVAAAELKISPPELQAVTWTFKALSSSF